MIKPIIMVMIIKLMAAVKKNEIETDIMDGRGALLSLHLTTHKLIIELLLKPRKKKELENTIIIKTFNSAPSFIKKNPKMKLKMIIKIIDRYLS
jgi:hypothetical protein